MAGGDEFVGARIGATSRARIDGSPHTRRWLVHRGLLAAVDALVWTGAIVLAAVLRLEFDVAAMPVPGLLEIVFLAVVSQLAVGGVLRAYSGRHCVGTLADAATVSTTVAVVGIGLFATNLVLTEQLVPRSVPLIAALIAQVAAVGARTAVRAHRERGDRPDRASAQPVIVFGAGTEGQQVVRAMLSDRESGYLPVALLDDDPDLRMRHVLGVAVRGPHADLVGVARETGAELLVIAVRGLEAVEVREIAVAASEAGLGVKIMPPLTEALRPWVRLEDLRDVDLTGLLGRAPVEIDMSAVAEYVEGRRVLVTGAGGSIGSELCRQLNRLDPATLVMLDRDESALHATQLSLYGTALLDSDDVVLTDIRDAAALGRVFATHRPEVVFHAAALKHLPLLERYPEEAWETNVLGTENVLEAAARVGVSRFVNVSTDKAANPTSVLGRSKRIGERLVAHAALRHRADYLSVRFGNVLGSRGSVLTTFAEQIASGASVTVTHPEVTRFFMTIPEAVELMLYAGAIARRREVLILDMGAPVRIADVAQRLLGLAGRSGPIVFTGLRDGEKLHEELLGGDEVDRRPVHPAVSHVEVPVLDPARARAAADSLGPAAAMVELVAGADAALAPAGRPREEASS